MATGYSVLEFQIKIVIEKLRLKRYNIKSLQEIKVNADVL